MPHNKFDLNLIPPSPNVHFEQVLWAQGMQYIAGIDEAGRGALAGPVSAAAVVLPNLPDILPRLHGVRDSKVMPAPARAEWAEAIQQCALSTGVGFASPEEIDDLGIVPATRLAAMRALARLRHAPQHLLIDAISIPGAGLPETSLIKGDARSLSIACASVLAKVARDARMVELHEKYPAYGFLTNKGYGTLEHRQAILAEGFCPQHRLSFEIKSFE